ncbi:hypothetical protein GCM10007108_10630 [Thermogymnomonas acidicola]|uniref:Uncharacterized protein n=2 Tax=Thermogymnomonas acidicola TaxID=399579 RepID=A0AA37F9P0_9ARCH|nr:hypothetical protein GCM10007108_10630 [Thermogymnomonas acidicola]
MRQYVGKNVNSEKLVTLISEFFKDEGFRTVSCTCPQGVVFMARKGGIYRALLRTDRAFLILIDGNPSDTKIKIGVSRWQVEIQQQDAQKIFQSPLSYFLEIPESLWPYELEHHLWHFIETQVELGTQ